MLNQQSYIVDKIQDTCSECGRVIVGEAHMRYGRVLCFKCTEFYSRWPERKPEAEEAAE